MFWIHSEQAHQTKNYLPPEKKGEGGRDAILWVTSKNMENTSFEKQRCFSFRHRLGERSAGFCCFIQQLHLGKKKRKQKKKKKRKGHRAEMDGKKNWNTSPSAKQMSLALKQTNQTKSQISDISTLRAFHMRGIEFVSTGEAYCILNWSIALETTPVVIHPC